MSSFDPFDDTMERFPDAPPNPMYTMALITRDSAPMTTVGDDLRATDAQLKLKPGDWAIPAMSEAIINCELTVLRLLDPESFAGRYPDWEDRLMKSWVFTEWYSSDDPDRPQYGWFERSRLMPCTREQGEELIAFLPVWDREEDPTMPDWYLKLYEDSMEALYESDPSKISRRIACEKCGQKEVEIHGIAVARMAAPAGEREIHGKVLFVNIDDPDHDVQVRYHLHCQNCSAQRELDDGEFHVHGQGPFHH